MRLDPDTLAQALEGGADRRRMVGEVVVNRDAPRLAPDLHAAAYAAEARERFDCGGGLYADVARGGKRRQRVHPVVCPQ